MIKLRILLVYTVGTIDTIDRDELTDIYFLYKVTKKYTQKNFQLLKTSFENETFFISKVITSRNNNNKNSFPQRIEQNDNMRKSPTCIQLNYDNFQMIRINPDRNSEPKGKFFEKLIQLH